MSESASTAHSFPAYNEHWARNSSCPDIVQRVAAVISAYGGIHWFYVSPNMNLIKKWIQ